MSDRHTSNIRNDLVHRTLGLLALGLLVMPMLPLLVPVSAATFMPDLDETEFQLQVTPSAPKLPADRNSYHAIIQLQVVDSESPIEAPHDMEITIISSDPSVLLLPEDKVVLSKGDSMTEVDLTTTDKAGVATITAQADRVKSATASITSYRMDSLEPTRLAIYVAPSNFIPDPQHPGLLYIQVLNSQNLPTTSKNDIAVDISSSDPTIGIVQSYAIIPAGSSGILINFIPQKSTGDTVVRASALGLVPGELIVTVDGPVASKLIVDFAPEKIPAVNYYDAMMTVQLADENEEPVKASKTTRVLLRSSDTSIVQVPSYIEIPAGKSYATTAVESKGKIGSATITASATGFATGISNIDAVALSLAGTNDPKQLQIYSLPRVLPPDNSEHQSIVVAFQDMNGNPYRQTGYLYQRIAISTSNVLVGEITSTAFGTKETYAVAKFTTNYAIGETEITAALEGYVPAQMTLRIAGSGPASVVVTQIPEIVESNNFESGSVVVSLVDHEGRLATAQEDTVVYLSSSDPEIATIQASATIRAGDTHAVALTHATLRAGTTTITGSSDGLGAGSIVYRTVGFTGSISEYHLGLYAVPKLPADGKEYASIVVQLQDRAGFPVLAKSDVKISLSSGSLNAGSVEENVVITKGTSQTTAIFKTSLVDDESFKITASSPGFTSVEAEMETTVQPLTMFRTSELATSGTFGDDIPISVTVYSGSIPVHNAIVTITGVNAEETQVTTDESGNAEGKYIAQLPGQNTIIIKVNKPGYEEYEITERVNLQQAVDITISPETESGTAIAAQVKVTPPKGVKIPSTKTGGTIQLESVGWGSYFLSAPAQVKTSSAIYDFARWSDGSTYMDRSWSVVDDAKISAIYKARYLLQINDVNGKASGGGYYEEDQIAVVSVPTTSIPGLVVDKEFAGWSGAINAASPTTEIVMDGPKTVNVEWKDNYMKVALIAAAVGGVGFIYYWKVFKPKRKLVEKQRAPDLDWYKS